MPALRSITFILNRPRNPQNIGAAARGMANFGFRSLAVVEPYAVAWREARAAVHAEEVLKKAKKFSSLKAAVARHQLIVGTSAGSRRKTDARRALSLDAFVKLLRGRGPESMAVLFGSEKTGLSNADLAFCHYIVRIPTVPECPSMNLAQAVAVVAHALREENTSAAPLPAEAPVPVDRLERLVSQGLEAFTASGLLTGWDAARSERRLRKAFYQWNLSLVDIAMLHGLFRWVLKQAARARAAGVEKPPEK